MILIPELTDSAVRETAKCKGGWCAPVGNQDRLPYREHLNPGVRVLVEQALNCGGPPQTNGSTRRQQKDDAHEIGGTVKVASQGIERSCREIGQAVAVRAEPDGR